MKADEIWTRERMLAKLRRIFPANEREAALQALDGIAVIGSGASLQRIQLGVLRLCEERREQLAYWIDIAGRDWRDIIAFAESPGECTRLSPATPAQSPQAQTIRAADRKSYVAWLLDLPEEDE